MLRVLLVVSMAFICSTNLSYAGNPCDVNCVKNLGPTPCTAAVPKCGVFLSSMKVSGNMTIIGDLSGGTITPNKQRQTADDICQFEGNRATPGTRWRAFLGVDGSSPISHALSSRVSGYYLAGTSMLSFTIDTIDGSAGGDTFATPFCGAHNIDAIAYYTGSTATGGVAPANCNDWTSNDNGGGITGSSGNCGLRTSGAIAKGDIVCNVTQPLMCVQQLQG